MRIRHLGITLFAILGACSGQITTLENIGSVHPVDASVPPVLQSQAQLAPYGSTAYVALEHITEDNLAELQFSVVSPPDNGSIQDAGVSMSFTPNPGFEGVDRVTVVARRGNQTSNPAVISFHVVSQVLAWIECGAPDELVMDHFPAATGIAPGMTLMQLTLAGIEHWAKVSDSVIVSCISSTVQPVFSTLMSNKPAGLRIIGGLKPVHMPGCAAYDPATYDFADGPSWQIVAQDVQRIVALTGTPIVVLENEPQLLAFHFQNQSIDFNKLRTSLIPLQQTGIETWWWLPQIYQSRPDNPDLHEETIAFVSAVAETLPNAKFITSYNAWQEGKLNHYGEMTSRNEMIQLVGINRMIELSYVTKTGTWSYPDPENGGTYEKPCFSVEQALQSAEIEPSQPMMIYPGGKDWLSVAQEFSQRYFQRP